MGRRELKQGGKEREEGEGVRLGGREIKREEGWGKRRVT